MNQTEMKAISDFWEQVMVAIEKAVLLPANIERKFCVFDHSLEVKNGKSFYTLTIAGKFSQYNQVIKLEANDLVALYVHIQKYFEFVMAE